MSDNFMMDFENEMNQQAAATEEKKVACMFSNDKKDLEGFANGFAKEWSLDPNDVFGSK